jgi:hypothetical protein
MAATAIREPWEQRRVLMALAPQLPAALLREALSMIRTIGDEGWRAQALVGLVAPLPALQRHDALSEALAAARAIADSASRVLALAGLTPYLPEPLKSNTVQETLTRARHRSDRSATLVKLAPYLAEPLRSEVLREALAATHMIRDGMAEQQVQEQVRSL